MNVCELWWRYTPYQLFLKVAVLKKLSYINSNALLEFIPQTIIPPLDIMISIEAEEIAGIGLVYFHDTFTVIFIAILSGK